MHLSEEELVELFYGDATVTSRRHLTDCEECRERSAEVSGFLAGISDPGVPEPDEEWEERLWSRLDGNLSPRRSWSKRRIALAAAAVLAALIGGLLITYPSPEPVSTAEESHLAVDDADRDRVLMMVIMRHLDEAERVVLELNNTEAASIGEESASRAEELLAINRLYRQSAEAAGNNEAARLLAELELVLLETARGEAASGSVELIRELITEGELLFRMNILRNEIRQGEWATTHPSV